jgi:diguanylate cyclase (GGDEF)-like protein
MLDLDHLKRLNDDHGHLVVGDQVLREVAEAISRVLRTSDTAYRYGGEELVVLLRETSLDDGLAVAERIRAALTTVRIPGAPGVTVTCSAGVAERLSGMGHHNELVAVADDVLYEAKRQGRNPVLAASLEHATVHDRSKPVNTDCSHAG